MLFTCWFKIMTACLNFSFPGWICACAEWFPHDCSDGFWLHQLQVRRVDVVRCCEQMLCECHRGAVLCSRDMYGTYSGRGRDVHAHCLGLVFLIDMGMRMSFVVCVQSVGCRVAPSQAADDLRYIKSDRGFMWTYASDICRAHVRDICGIYAERSRLTVWV